MMACCQRLRGHRTVSKVRASVLRTRNWGRPVTPAPALGHTFVYSVSGVEQQSSSRPFSTRVPSWRRQSRGRSPDSERSRREKSNHHRSGLDGGESDAACDLSRTRAPLSYRCCSASTGRRRPHTQTSVPVTPGCRTVGRNHRSACRQHIHEDASCGSQSVAANQQCTAGTGSAQGPTPVGPRTGPRSASKSSCRVEHTGYDR